MDTPVTQGVHEEFRHSVNAEVKRLDEQHKRNSKRLDIVEEKIEKQGELITQIHELALSVKGMQEQLTTLNERVGEIEGRDGEMWRKVVAYAVTAVVGVLVGYVATRVGLA